MPSETGLDDEIASLKARVESLKAQVRLQATALLTTAPARRAIAATAAAAAAAAADHHHHPTQDPLQARVERQQAHDQQCLYRTCAGVTTFRVRDPDPSAVDGGSVLGVRIEVMTRSKFIRPYYVLLNRPYSSSSSGGGGDGGQGRRLLRVHRHTVPPCIPIGGLAARYLPAPRARGVVADELGGEVVRQDLPRFVRCLRREILRYHSRVAVIADLRRAAGLDGGRGRGRRGRRGSPAGASPLLAVSAADAGAKQVRIDWKDGRSGRLVVGDDGDVARLVVFGGQGRDREAARELLGGGSRLEDVARRLGSA